MKQIEDHKQETANAKTLYSAATENTTKPASESSRRKLVMTTLWQRMAEIFGNQWELNYGGPDGGSIATWTNGLADYSEDQIRHGVQQCLKWESGFIPNLGQFARMCLTKPKQNFTDERIAREVTTAQLVKPKRGDSEVAKREKERMRRIMAGEDIESKEESIRKLGLNRYLS